MSDDQRLTLGEDLEQPRGPERLGDGKSSDSPMAAASRSANPLSPARSQELRAWPVSGVVVVDVRGLTHDLDIGQNVMPSP